MTRAFRPFALALVLIAAIAAPAFAKEKIGILGLEAAIGPNGALDEADTKVARELTDALRERPKQGLGKYSLVPDRKELVDEKLMAGCNEEKPPCMAPIGAGMGANVLLFGKIEKGKNSAGVDGYTVTLKLIDVDKKIQTGILQGEFLPLSETKGSQLVDWAVQRYKRITGEQLDGTLVLTVSNSQTGTLLVDGKARGNVVGGTAKVTLSEGRYRIGVEADGFKVWEETDVTIRGGEDTSRDIELVALDVIDRGGTVSQGRPGGGWRIASYVGGAVTVGTGVVYVMRWQDLKKTGGSWPKYGAGCNEETLEPLPNSGAQNCKDGKSLSRDTYIFGISMAVAGVFTGYAVYKGFISSNNTTETNAVGRRVRPRRERFTVTPIVSPQGGGATLRFDW